MQHAWSPPGAAELRELAAFEGSRVNGFPQAVYRDRPYPCRAYRLAKV